MTKGGMLVEFSIGEPHYLSPNALGQTAASSQDYSVKLLQLWFIFVGIAQCAISKMETDRARTFLWWPLVL